MSSRILISNSALAYNLRAFRRVIGNSQLLSVVKANAYGHGLVLTAKAIERLTDWFGTASGSEGVELRASGIRKPILVMNYYSDREIATLLKNKISLAVYDARQVTQIGLIAKKLKIFARVHIKIDTGTSRFGIFPEFLPTLVTEIKKYKNLKIEGLFSHLAASEDNRKFTNEQLESFASIRALARALGLKPIEHVACTASLLAFPDSWADLVRLGIGLYGLSSYKSQGATLKKYPNLKLRPVLSWVSELVNIKKLPKGKYVGYGCTYKTSRPMVVGVVPVGYYEGYDRGFSNNSEMLIRGIRCPVIGRVFMNLTIVDITKVDNPKLGEAVVLIGKQGQAEITADELAQKINTINYEIVSRINPLIPRILTA